MPDSIEWRILGTIKRLLEALGSGVASWNIYKSVSTSKRSLKLFPLIEMEPLSESEPGPISECTIKRTFQVRLIAWLVQSKDPEEAVRLLANAVESIREAILAEGDLDLDMNSDGIRTGSAWFPNIQYLARETDTTPVSGAEITFQCEIISPRDER